MEYHVFARSGPDWFYRDEPGAQIVALCAAGGGHLTADDLARYVGPGNPATYIKAWDRLRMLFAAEPEAQLLKLTPSHFSFNVAVGRCEACSGEGHETVEMQFLADVSLTCPVCRGRRWPGWKD